MDKVWPFFTGGVIIDAELEGTEILFHLLSSHSDRQNRREEKRPLEWSGTGTGSHGAGGGEKSQVSQTDEPLGV